MKEKLTADKIMNLEFHIDFKGYNPQEVDRVLDDVMHDYDHFQNIIASQKELLNRYEEKVDELNRKIMSLEAAKVTTQELPSQFSHVDILKRVSRLEEAVFNNNK